MKTVKLKFDGFWPGFNPEDFFLTQILKKHYHVEISENPDYVICSGFGFYEYLENDAVRILFSGENYVPDFNYVDYALSVYPIDFLDRHFSFPGLVLTSYDFLQELEKKDRDYDSSILDSKPYFANLIAGHESENNLRGEMLKLLGSYRRVESAGAYLNNMPNGEKVQMRDGTKLALQKKCKFTFCGESLAHEGFITEKIFDAFLADTIPIYYGSSTISQVVNKNAYIDVRDYDSLQAVLDKIIELDQDDEKYMQMLRQPVFADKGYVENKIAALEAFIQNIFDQPLEAAYRRGRRYMPARYEKQLLNHKKLMRVFVPKKAVQMKELAQRSFWKTVEKMILLKRKLIAWKNTNQ